MAEPLKHLAWDDFRLVKAVADARGMPGAAAELGINHSTVFRRLGQIEEALGTILFERHRTGYALTPAGEEMVSLAQRLDGDITAFTRKIAGQVVAPEGELRVTTNDSAQQIQFFKNVAIMGGLLFYFASGPGAFRVSGALLGRRPGSLRHAS